MATDDDGILGREAMRLLRGLGLLLVVGVVATVWRHGPLGAVAAGVTTIIAVAVPALAWHCTRRQAASPPAGDDYPSEHV